MKRAWTCLLPLIAASAALQACGGDDGSTAAVETSITSAPETEESSMSMPAEADGGDLDMDDAESGSGGMSMGAAPECPEPPTFEAPPERVVTQDQGAAAFLVELGVADRIVGTAGTDFAEDFDGEVRATLDALPVIDERVATREPLIALEPDLVTGISIFEFGGFDGTATPDQLAEVGAEVLVACDVAVGTSSGIDATYDYVTDLAEIFDVPEAGLELNARIRGEVEAATAPYADADPVRVMTLSAAPDGGQPINTSGGSGLASAIIELAGGDNIAADVDGDFAELSAEAVIDRDPEAIVVVTGLFGDDPAELVEAIRTSPVLAGTTAVQDGRVFAVPQTRLLSPSVLNGSAVATIAEGIHAPAP